MRTAVLLLLALLAAPAAGRESSSSHVEIVTLFSQNERFFLKTIPFDNVMPSMRGRTLVYEKGAEAPLYVLERGFHFRIGGHDNLYLSDDGQVIFYANTYEALEDVEGLKSVNIYRRGQIVRSFTESEITGCDEKTERCTLVYSKYHEVVDEEKSWAAPGPYTKVFKPGVDEREKFLSDHAIFLHDDTVYMTDSKKRVHLFDLRKADYAGSEPFDKLYEGLRAKARETRVEAAPYEAPVYLDFPPLKGGGDTARALARHLGMKPAKVDDVGRKYKIYTFTIDATVKRDGGLEIEAIDVEEGLPKEKIVEFFTSNKFDRSAVPDVFERWFLGREYFYLRKKDDRAAREEGRQERRRTAEELARQVTAESIGGVYIPKDLGECMAELDKILSEIDRRELRELPNREDTIRYHLGFGMWLRNTWRLWAGSRLQKYFTDRGVHHPDEMSSIILEHYHDWLNGRRETWKMWELNRKAN